MGFVMPELVMRMLLENGIRQLRQNRTAFDDIFGVFIQDELGLYYGADYREQIWNWFSTTKIPVVQAWSFNAQKIPSISIHLANETEDESKAALNDFAGIFDDEEETGTGVFTAMIDIGIHANKGGDHVLWLYYIVAYLLMKHKLSAHRLGIKLGTFSASDYQKDAAKMGSNVWTRWVRFRCTTQNFWGANTLSEAKSINILHTVDNEEASQVAASLDVDLSEVDLTANQGLKVSHGNNGDDDMNL